MLQQPSRRRNNNIRTENMLLFDIKIFFSSNQQSYNILMILAHSFQHVENLNRQFPRRDQNNRPDPIGGLSIQQFQEWNEKGQRFATPGPCRRENVPSAQGVWDTRHLNGRHGGIVVFDQSADGTIRDG